MFEWSQVSSEARSNEHLLPTPADSAVGRRGLRHGSNRRYTAPAGARSGHLVAIAQNQRIAWSTGIEPSTSRRARRLATRPSTLRCSRAVRPGRGRTAATRVCADPALSYPLAAGLRRVRYRSRVMRWHRVEQSIATTSRGGPAAASYQPTRR